MGRLYTVEFQNVAVTAQVDFFELTPADDKPVSIAGIELYQSTDVGDAAEEILDVRVVRGHTTGGSGGAAPTPTPVDPVDAAAGFTAETNNTTIASVGTTTNVWSGSFNIRTGLQLFLPPEFWIKASQTNTTIIVRLRAAPTDSLSMSGTLWVWEY